MDMERENAQRTKIGPRCDAAYTQRACSARVRVRCCVREYTLSSWCSLIFHIMSHFNNTNCMIATAMST